MKITDSKVVQSGEKAFLNAVKDHLDWTAIREVVTKKMKQCAIESKGGELVLHENSVAFRMDLHCSMDVSITFDRDGNLVSDAESLAGASMTETPPIDPAEQPQPVSPPPLKKQKQDTASTRRPPLMEDSAELDDDENDDVLELNDLLDELPSESDKKSSTSSRKEDPESGDDDMDLETLFFKDKPDDDELDSMDDEGSAFWEDKK